jgi:hypothetical protein
MNLECRYCRQFLYDDHRCPPQWETCDDYDGIQPAYGHTAEDAAIWFRAEDPDDWENGDNVAVRVAVRKEKADPWQHFDVSCEYRRVDDSEDSDWFPRYTATPVGAPDDWYDPEGEP